MSLGRSGPGVRSGFLETPRTRFGGIFLASAQTASQFKFPDMRAFRAVTVTRRCGSSRHEDAIGHAYVQVHVVVERGAEAVQEGDAATDGHAVSGHAAGGDTPGDCCDSCDQPRSHDSSRIAWAKLMARVGEEFPLECPGCGGDIRLIAFITEPGPIRKVLTHLGEPLEPPPVSPARGPPADWGELVQVDDDRAVFQASPVELPDIDIHSL